MLSLLLPMPVIGADNFSGTWHYVQCGETNRASDCRGFTLVLVQEGTRLCGVHGIHAPPVGNEQLDNGSGPSVSGTVRGNRAVIKLVHGITGMIAKARLSLVGDKVQWRLLEEEGEPYLPNAVSLVPALYPGFAAEAKRKCAGSPNPMVEGDAHKGGARPSP